MSAVSDLTSISESDRERRRSMPQASSSSSAAQRSVLCPGNARPRALTCEHSREWSQRTR